MQTVAIQCDVKGCSERCSDQDREQPRIPDAPPPRTAEWVYLRTNAKGGDRWLCPGHALVLHALFVGWLELVFTGALTATAPSDCSVREGPKATKRKASEWTPQDMTTHRAEMHLLNIKNGDAVGPPLDERYLLGFEEGIRAERARAMWDGQ